MNGGRPRISVVGLGKLGCPLAVCFAAKGYTVIGADIDPRKSDAINHGEMPVFEPGLPSLMEATEGRLTATADIPSAVAASDVTFVVVPTPSEADGSFSLQYVLGACRTIAQGLAGKTEFHLVVLTSTVMPGSTGNEVRDTLEGVSKKRCPADFGLCYGPAFVALGSVVRDYMNPDFVLIGESDPASGDILEGIHRTVCENSPPVARMNFVELHRSDRRRVSARRKPSARDSAVTPES